MPYALPVLSLSKDAPCHTSHPELRKEVPRLENSGHPDQDEREANPKGFHFAIAKETEQRVGDKNESSNRGEQNQCEKVVGVTVSHEVEIEQRTGNQDGAYESTYERISADSSANALNLWVLIHQLSLARSFHSLEYTESFVVTSLVRIKLPRCGRDPDKSGPTWNS